MILKPSEVHITKNRKAEIDKAYQKIEKEFNEEIAGTTKHPFTFWVRDIFGNELDEEVHKLFLENLSKAGWYVRYEVIKTKPSKYGYYTERDGYRYIISDTEFPPEKEQKEQENQKEQKAVSEKSFWQSVMPSYKKWI